MPPAKYDLRPDYKAREKLAALTGIATTAQSLIDRMQAVEDDEDYQRSYREAVRSATPFLGRGWEAERIALRDALAVWSRLL